MDRECLLNLAKTYVWWMPADKVMSGNLDRLTASVMELGTWEDANALLDILGPKAFIAVLNAPPPGVISDRSLAFWHYRLSQPGLPPRAERRFQRVGRQDAATPS